MSMAVTASRYKGYTNTSVAHALVTHFSGQLKGWWDHYLIENER